MYRIRLSLSGIFPLLVLLSCAHQLAPGGGPADTTGPTIVSCEPSDGSLNVSTSSKIVFLFSEWISKKDPTIISIYPPLKHDLKINKNRLEIIPDEPMSDSQSYHVIVSSKLQDLHSNSFTTAYSLVFSTGSSLDSGTISGCVVDSWEKSTRTEISLFSEKVFKDSGYRSTPSYKIETDSIGKFNFNFIKQGHYRVTGFSMQRATAPSSNVEKVFIPEDSLILISSTPTFINLYPALIDTSFPRITSIKAENQRYVVGTWNKIVDTTIFKPTIRLINPDSSELSVPITIVPFGTPQRLAIIPQKTFTVAPWKCVYSVSRVFDTITFSDTLLFNSTVVRDTTKPTLRSSLPNTAMFLTQSIDLIWSEPVLISSALYLFDSLGDTVSLQSNTGYNDTTRLTPMRSLKAGTLYKLVILNKYGSDLSSNQLLSKDSTDTVSKLHFSTINFDSIGISLRGGSDCPLMTNKKLKWLFFPFGKSGHFISENDSNTFSFDSIPAGKGTIGVFIDKNGNKVPDRGSLIPWKTPEPFYMYADTVEARARWEIEGVRLKGCQPCIKTLY